MFGLVETSVLSHFASVLQLSLSIVFLLSAIPKLRQPLTFAQSVVEYKIFPAKIAYVIALALVPAEALLAMAFFTGWLTDIALPLAMVLLLAFLGAVGINLRRGRRIPCGCFGDASEQISLRTFTRLLLLLTVILLLMAFRSIGGASLPSLGVMAADVFLIVYFLLTAFLAVFLILLASWILSLPELVSLIRNSR